MSEVLPVHLWMFSAHSCEFHLGSLPGARLMNEVFRYKIGEQTKPNQ